MPRRNQIGVTLIELMVVVAIVAILASIAVPSYKSYVLRTHRTDAVRGLTINAQILQRCYSQTFSFNACAGLSGASANGYYNLTSATPGPPYNTYTLTATPTGMQTADTTCATFSLDQTGKETALDSGNNDQSLVCWGAN